MLFNVRDSQGEKLTPSLVDFECHSMRVFFIFFLLIEVAIVSTHSCISGGRNWSYECAMERGSCCVGAERWRKYFEAYTEGVSGGLLNLWSSLNPCNSDIHFPFYHLFINYITHLVTTQSFCGEQFVWVVIEVFWEEDLDDCMEEYFWRFSSVLECRNIQ